MRAYATIMPDGSVAITRLAVPQRVRADFDNEFDFIAWSFLNDEKEVRALPKTMFELSRTTDIDSHFDSAVHTLDAIAAGLPGHTPLACVEIDDVDLPLDRAQRNRWELRDGRVQVRP